MNDNEETKSLSDDIPREELVKGAKTLKKWAESLGLQRINDIDVHELLHLVAFELDFQEDFRIKYGLEIFLHTYIHSRFEYFSKIISYLLHVSLSF